jgi:hypothetical protein
MKSEKKKIKEIEYKKLELQSYLKNDSHLTTNEINVIFSRVAEVILESCLKATSALSTVKATKPLLTLRNTF